MSMNEAVLAVAQAQQQGDAIPVDTPPMTQSAPGMGKPPVTPKTRVDTMEEPRLWPEIRQLIEDDIQNAPRELQREIGPSELGTDCVHCLAAKLAGWPERRSPGWLPFIGTCVHAHFETMFRELNGEPAAQFPYTSEDNVHCLAERWRSEYRVTVGRLQGVHGGYDVTGSIDLWDRKTHSTIDWKIVGNTTVTKVKAHGPSQQYRGQASLYSIVQMPKGVPVATFAIGEAGAANAAIYAVRMLSMTDDTLAEKLEQFRASQNQAARDMVLPTDDFSEAC